MYKTIFSILCLLFSASVEALSTEFTNMYFGGDVGQSLSGHKLNKVRHRTDHQSQFINVYGGYKLSDNVAIETGVHTSFSLNKKHAKKMGQTKHLGAHAGLVFSMPLYQDLEGLAGASLALNKSQISKIGAYGLKKNVLSPRLMVGAQYEILPALKLRGSVSYLRTRNRMTQDSKLSLYDNYKFGAGLNYQF